MNSKAFDAWYREFPATYAELKPSPPSPGKVRYRFMELDHTRAKDEQRTVEATLSTETPVMRSGYREILQHSAQSVNLERAVDGKLPLLWGHDQNQQIGIAENVRILNGKLRACLRFSTSARGEEIWNDVKAGIVRGLSIGYYIDDHIERETDSGWDDVVATRWTPFETSCVSCPADLSAGIGRALESGSVYKLPPKWEILSHQARLHERYGMMIKKEPSIVHAEDMQEPLARIQTRMMSVKTKAEADACLDLIGKTHLNYWADLDDSEEVRGIRAVDPYSGRPHNNQLRGKNTMGQEFSLCRAIAMQFDPGAMRAGGHEIEVMQQTANRAGKRSTNGGYTLPEEELFRAVTKGGSGGNLVGVEHMGNDFITALRTRLVTGRMGATLLPGLTGDIQIPKQLTDAAAGWIAGDGSDEVGASDPTYGKITMAPKTVGVKSTLSRKMILQGDPASEMLLRNSLAFAVAKAIDTAALVGDGTGNVPVGILETADIGTSEYAPLPNTTMFGQVVDMEGDLLIEDADMGNLGYVTTGAVAAKLKQTPIYTTGEQMIWTSRGEGEGLMNGYRAAVSNIVPAGYILFGNWSDLVIGMWSGFDFTVDPYTRAAYGDVVITVLVDCDVAVRHGESFSELHESA